MIALGIGLAFGALGSAALFGTIVGMFPQEFETRRERREARIYGWSYLVMAIALMLAAIAILGVHG